MMTIKQNTAHFDFSSCFFKKDKFDTKSVERAIDLCKELQVTKVKLIVDSFEGDLEKQFKKELMPELRRLFGDVLEKDIVKVHDLFSMFSFLIPKEKKFLLTQAYQTYAKQFPKVLEGIYQMYGTYGILPKSGVNYFVSNVFDNQTLYRVGNLDVICMRL